MTKQRFDIVGLPPEHAKVSGIEHVTNLTVGYVRVSKETDRPELSPETQKRVIRDYCQLQGLGEPVLYEEAKSAKSIKGRPVLLKVLEMCRAGQVRHLVVQDLTRFLRSEVREALGLLAELEEQHGVQVHGAKDIAVDPATAEGEWIRTLQLANSRLERRRMGERVSRVLRATRQVTEEMAAASPVLAARKAQGKLFSGGGAPFGYRWSGGKKGRRKLVPDPHDYPIVKRIEALRSEGLGGRRITHLLFTEGVRNRSGKVVPRSTVERVLRRGYF